MKVMIDTNVLLDVLLEREPFVAYSTQILRLCENGSIVGTVSASSVTDLFYIIRKNLHDTDKTYQIIGVLLGILDICSVSGTQIKSAFALKAKDFEDCLLAVCAKAAGCEYIITRNKKDFADFGITLYSPDEFLDFIK